MLEVAFFGDAFPSGGTSTLEVEPQRTFGVKKGNDAVLSWMDAQGTEWDMMFPQPAPISIHKFYENIRYESWAGEKRNDFTAVTEHSQASCEWGICYSSSEAMARWSLAHSKSICVHFWANVQLPQLSNCAVSAALLAVPQQGILKVVQIHSHTHKKTPNKNKILKGPVRTAGKISGFTCPCYGFFYSFMTKFSLWLASWNLQLHVRWQGLASE